MSLRFKLLITSLVMIVLTGVLGATMLFVEGQVSTTADQELNVNKVVSSILDLDVMTDKLSANYSVAGAAQWQQAAQQINGQLVTGNFDQQNEKDTSAEVKQDLTTMGTTMTNLIDSQLTASASSTKAKDAAFKQLTAQTQASLSDSFKLQQIVGENLLATQSSTRTTIIALSGLLMVVVIGSLFYLFMTVTAPINGLTAVIEDISRGKLDTAISSKTLAKKDEIGMLARAFDRTIVSLKLAMRDETGPDTPLPHEEQES